MTFYVGKTQPDMGSSSPSLSGAIFSECRRYRYSLWRRWGLAYSLLDNWHDSESLCAFIGLNPSTADETADDPTIRRCINFAKSWGHTGMVMLNLFAFRATDPNVMKAEPEPIGPLNDEAIQAVATYCSHVVCCWGNHGSHLERSRQLRKVLPHTPLWHFGLTKSLEPKHPLYLLASTKLKAY